MTWAVKEAKSTLDRGQEVILVTLSQETTGADGKVTEETRVVRHYRSAGQTLPQWRANVRNEVRALLGSMNPATPPETDVTAAVS